MINIHGADADSSVNALSMTTDAQDNTYVVGGFHGTVDFGGGNVIDPNSGTGLSIFIAKYASDGALMWVRTIGSDKVASSYGDLARSVVVDISGNIYIGGAFKGGSDGQGNLDFDPGPGTAILNSPNTNGGSFALKLNGAGEYQWALAVNAPVGSVSNAIALSDTGEVYMLGNYTGNGSGHDAVITDGTGAATIFGSTDEAGHLYLLKADATTGALMWVESGEGYGGTPAANALSVAPDGTVYATGSYYSVTVDGQAYTASTSSNPVSYSDAFVWKLSAFGATQSFRSIISLDASDAGNALHHDADGNLYVTGRFQGTADFDMGAGVVNATSAGINDAFVAKYDDAGDLRWNYTFGSSTTEMADSIAEDANGDIYVSGTFTGTVDFEDGPGNTSLTSLGLNDAYIMKLSKDGEFQWVRGLGSVSGSDSVIGMSPTASGNIRVTVRTGNTMDVDPGPGITNAYTSAANKFGFAIFDWTTDGELVTGSPPTVTADNIAVGGATGTAGSFRIGDTLSVTWDNSIDGDDNADILAVTADLSGFGGAANTPMTEMGNGLWVATLALEAGMIDATNVNISITVTGEGGIATRAGTSDSTVDLQAPTVSQRAITLNDTAFEPGDTLTVSWINSAAGDNNTDAIDAVHVDFSSFGGPSSVGATLGGGVWTASYVLPAEVTPGKHGVSVSITDNAGNMTTLADDDRAVVTVNTAPSASHLDQSHTFQEDDLGVELDDIVVIDPDENAVITATVTLDNPAAGELVSSDGSYDVATGIWTTSGTVSEANAALAALAFVPALNFNGTVTLTTGIRDEKNAGPAEGLITLAGTPVNDAPSIGGITPFSQITDQETASPFAGITLDEPDVGDTVALTVQLDAPSLGGFTELSLLTSGFTDMGSGLYTLAATAPSAAQEAIRQLVFQPHENLAPSGNVQNVGFTVTVTDLASESDNNSDTTIAITSVNDAPTLTASATDSTFTQGGATATLFAGSAVSTIEPGQNIVSLTLSLSGIADPEQEFLQIAGTEVLLSNGNTVQLPGMAAAATISLADDVAGVSINGTLTPAQAQELIDGLRYGHIGNDIGGTRTATLTSLSDDGNADHTVTLNIASTITLRDVNDAPTLTAQGANATFTENGADAILFSAVAVDPIESTQDIVRLTLSVQGLQDGSHEHLVIDGTPVALLDGASGVTQGPAGLLYAVSAADGIANVSLGAVLDADAAKALVEGLAYRNTSDAPGLQARSIEITSILDNGGTEYDGVAETLLSGQSASITLVAVNDAPTGSVTIEGLAQEDETLIAVPTVDDADGIGEISYQWFSDGAQIVDATQSNLMLTQEHVGSTITVAVWYVDDYGTSEEVVSVPTATVVNVNDSPLGTVTITGVATQKQTLQAGHNLTDEDGLGTVTYQWFANDADIDGATGDTYALTQAEVGKRIAVTARYTDQQGTTESVTSQATAMVENVNDAPTGAVTISGLAEQRQVLTASHTLDDADGMGTVIFQWQVGNIDIAGATGHTYELTQADVGQVISVVARYTDAFGFEERVSSIATTEVTNINDPHSGHVLISGAAQQGQWLTASHTLQDPDGINGLRFDWRADDVAIPGATGSTYQLQQADIGKTITAVALYTDDFHNEESVASAATISIVNLAPSFDDLPTGRISVTTGVPVPLPAIEINDGPGEVLTITLTPTNGKLTGLTDADPDEPGFQLMGSSSEILALLSAARFEAKDAGLASLGIQVRDLSNAVATATITFKAGMPPSPPPGPKLIDGVPVVWTITADSDGVERQRVEIPLASESRADTDPYSTLADIPLISIPHEYHLLSVHLPAGYAAIAQGPTQPIDKDAPGGLIHEIIGHTQAGSFDQEMLAAEGTGFLEGLAADTALVVHTVAVSEAPADTEAPGLLVRGGPATPEHRATAIVIDTTQARTATSHVTLEDVAFAAIVGSATITVDGPGSHLAGESAPQVFLLKGGDHLVRAGAGDDTLFASGGANKLYGNSGDDTLIMHSGVNFVHGGEGTDTLVLAGQSEDYEVIREHAMTWVRSHRDPQESHALVNVESIQFNDTVINIEHEHYLSWLAGLYERVLGRQAEVEGIQYWAFEHTQGMSAGEIAVSFIWSVEADLGVDASDPDSYSRTVDHLYEFLLGREAEDTGKAYWMEELAAGSTLGAVANGFMFTDEMRTHWLAQQQWEFFDAA